MRNSQTAKNLLKPVLTETKRADTPQSQTRSVPKKKIKIS